MTTGYAGTTSRQVGKRFTVTATPSARIYLWAGAATLHLENRLSLVRHVSEMTLQANFIPNFFTDLQAFTPD